MITLVLHGELRRFNPSGAKRQTLAGAGCSIRETLARMQIPGPYAAAAALVVNGEQVDDIDSILSDGDTLDVIPAMTGG